MLEARAVAAEESAAAYSAAAAAMVWRCRLTLSNPR